MYSRERKEIGLRNGKEISGMIMKQKGGVGRNMKTIPKHVTKTQTANKEAI